MTNHFKCKVIRAKYTNFGIGVFYGSLIVVFMLYLFHIVLAKKRR
jgi:hypothetical protein